MLRLFLRTLGVVMLVVPLVPVGVLLAIKAQEPTFPGCPKCGVIGYVDLPATSSTVSNAALLAGEQAIEGWGFECVSGAPVDRVDLYVEDVALTNVWHPVPEPANTSAGYNPRPDVEAAYVSLCPALLGRWPGFVRWVNNPLPLGAHRFTFVLWEGPYHVNLVKTLNVVP